MISLRASWQVLVLLRLHNCVIASASVALGAFLASGTVGFETLMAVLMAFFVTAGGYALNDLFDVESDRVVKPWRPLASGRLGRDTAVNAVIAVWAVGCGFALLAGLVTVVFFLAWVVYLYLYSWKLKSWGAVGPVTVGCFASSAFLLGGATGGDTGAAVFPFVIAMSLHLAREIAKSVADLEGDAEAGITTVAVRIGVRRALGFSLGSIVAVIAASLLPFVLRVYGYLYFMPVAFVIYPLLGVAIGILLKARGDPGHAQEDAGSVTRILKAVMPVGLVAFLLAGM